ncbi:(2Fe-2S) ferredoxin domain-containing protein [Halobacillus salinarum]|uniref:(2Fe-2S) ferredoxin domain-containing protein n=1 Tax=Halobacillus salinarum TaxID=2932257 RepID=A0ABY4EII3_9BACI|nr:(2Fe-2S) ferredoxin domain-containing protein [Halobacillus salinarum]UOQ44303.1 (2Fe-2S) ferredoxin domain-containing protein [Halobacillus salinarum]
MATWDLSNTNHHLMICNGSSCNKAGAEELTLALREEISAKGLDEKIHTTRTRCNGRCHDKCVVIDYPKGTWYKDLHPTDVPLLIELLLNNEDLTSKISHSFNGEYFQRENNVYSGVPKTLETVKRVSK